MIYGLEYSAAFHKAFQTPPADADDLSTLTRLLELSGARHYAEAEEQRHATLALQHLAEVQPRDTEASRALQALTVALIGRTH